MRTVFESDHCSKGYEFAYVDMNPDLKVDITSSLENILKYSKCQSASRHFQQEDISCYFVSSPHIVY